MFDITLTFDNGPEPDVTPGVLDTLAKADVPATFFVLGKKLADPRCRAIAERAAAQGHWIGNHTYNHETPLGRQTGERVAEDEIGRTQALIGDLTHPDKFFRPFGGGGAIGPHLMNDQVADFLKDGGYTCVLWNVISRDWVPEEADGWPERAMEIMKPLDWALVVIHDLPTGAMDHLERFIQMVRDAGGNFRQEFPTVCLPIVKGDAVGDLTPYVTTAG